MITRRPNSGQAVPDDVAPSALRRHFAVAPFSVCHLVPGDPDAFVDTWTDSTTRGKAAITYRRYRARALCDIAGYRVPRLTGSLALSDWVAADVVSFPEGLSERSRSQ